MLKRQIALLVTGTVVGLTTTVPAMAESDSLLPPMAKPGECYTRIFVPAQYETKTEEMVVADGTDFVEIIPAKFNWVEKQVLVKEEREQIEVVPATYKTVEEQVMIKPETEVLEVVPAVYDTVEEKVLVREGYTTWKTGRGPVEKIDDSTGEIMCLVEVPPEYKVIKHRKLVKAAETKSVMQPAEYETVKKQVIDKPTETVVTQIPAEYVTVKVQELAEAAKPERSPVPPEMVEVEKTVKVGDGGLQWKQILCETNMTRDVVAKIQNALKDAGAYGGNVDGALGPMTMRAVRAYQRSKNLASGQLTMETLQSLGVEL